jgi:hypothetical protein
MDEPSNDKIKVYLKIIDYKRSIGIIQWTILSIFTTASGAVFAFGLKESNNINGSLLRVFGVMVYWLGFLLYRRYRQFNRQVSTYLVKLEEENCFNFQKHLEDQFRAKTRLSTIKILLFAGVSYSIFALVMFFI